MNHTSMIARLTTDVTLEYKGANNTAVASFNVATPRDKNTSDFFKCVAFGKTAETIEKYVSKGQLIGLEGRFENNNYKDKDGKTHYNIQFVISTITFCGSKSDKQQDTAPTAPTPTAQEDEPLTLNIPDEMPFT